jgi:hypothetical protein
MYDNTYERKLVLVTQEQALSLYTQKKHSMAWVREQTIPTERPPLVDEVSANFCG